MCLRLMSYDVILTKPSQLLKLKVMIGYVCTVFDYAALQHG